MAAQEARRMGLVVVGPAVFIILLATAIYLGTSSLRLWDGVTPGARFLPVGLSLIGGALGFALLFSGWKGRDSGVLDLPNGFGWRRVAFSLLCLAAVTLLTPIVGMVPMIGLFMLVMLAAVLRQGLVASVVTALVVVAIVELIFVRWLAVPLPAPFGL